MVDNITNGIYQTIKERIINMQLRPGEVLMAKRLAEQLGASRTPVREALVRLAHEELIEPSEGRKFKVAELNLVRIMEIYDIRAALEGKAVAVAVEKATDEQLEQLERTHSILQNDFKQSDYDAFLVADFAFHQKIVEICGNQSMKKILENMAMHIQRIRYLTVNIEDRLLNTLPEHGAILDALKRRDSAEAQRALNVHFDAVSTGICELYNNPQKHYGLQWITQSSV
jgi:GntR family transcriptional regulator, rspAB operon transcriptional repressor